MPEGVGEPGVEGVERGTELPHPTERAGFASFFLAEGNHIAQVEQTGQGVSAAAGDAVEVGVGDQQAHPRTEQAVGPRLCGATGHQPVRG